MAERDWSAVYRRVKSMLIFMKEGRPSSALFKDSKGVSVDRDGRRGIEYNYSINRIGIKGIRIGGYSLPGFFYYTNAERSLLLELRAQTSMSLRAIRPSNI